ncbi:hypothetical protein JMJ56_18755 [Belnapia sp. T18]|uniref:Uncharacterized protein n=1 Tax=Belnapia arida TaxID=2804533 RepID=A0ABS1U9W4_9PROT|nr:hypothetical protein [Belnapia arida]MBL6080066.1 hypothetical protein [Belnapia arida]
MANDQMGTPTQHGRSGSIVFRLSGHKPGWRRGLFARLRPGLEAGLLPPGASDRPLKTMRVVA